MAGVRGPGPPGARRFLATAFSELVEVRVYRAHGRRRANRAAGPVLLPAFLPIDRGLPGRHGEGPPRAGPPGPVFRRSGCLPASVASRSVNPGSGSSSRRVRAPSLLSARTSPCRRARAIPGCGSQLSLSAGWLVRCRAPRPPWPWLRTWLSPASPRVRFFSSVSMSGPSQRDPERPPSAPRRPPSGPATRRRGRPRSRPMPTLGSCCRRRPSAGSDLAQLRRLPG